MLLVHQHLDQSSIPTTLGTVTVRECIQTLARRYHNTVVAILGASGTTRIMNLSARGGGCGVALGSRDKGARFPKGQTGVMPSFANNGIEAKDLRFLILGICILKSSPKFTCGSADEDLGIKIMQWRVKSLLTTAGSSSGVSGTS